MIRQNGMSSRHRRMIRPGGKLFPVGVIEGETEVWE